MEEKEINKQPTVAGCVVALVALAVVVYAVYVILSV